MARSASSVPAASADPSSVTSGPLAFSAASLREAAFFVACRPPSTGLKRQKPRMLSSDARLAKIRMATSDKTRRRPSTPVRNTFPERAAVSPAVTKPIASHPYRTVIGTLSKDESRFFLKKSEKSFRARKRRIRNRICPHSTTITQRATTTLPDICPNAGKRPFFHRTVAGFSAYRRDASLNGELHKHAGG